MTSNVLRIGLFQLATAAKYELVEEPWDTIPKTGDPR